MARSAPWIIRFFEDARFTERTALHGVGGPAPLELTSIGSDLYETDKAFGSPVGSAVGAFGRAIGSKELESYAPSTAPGNERSSPANFKNTDAFLSGMRGGDPGQFGFKAPARPAPGAPDTSAVTTTTSDFRVAPEATNAPPLPAMPTFLKPPPGGGIRPPSENTFDNAFDDFFNNRNNNTSGSSFDPFAGGDPFGDPTHGSVHVSQDDMDFAEQIQARVNVGLPPLDPHTGRPIGEPAPTTPGPADQKLDDLAGSELTPEERQIIAEEHRRNAREIALSSAQLVRVLPQWNAGTLTTTLVMPHRRGQLPSVRATVEYLVEHFGEVN